MNSKIRVWGIIVLLIAALMALGLWMNFRRARISSDGRNPVIYCTTFPVYLFTREVRLLLPPDLGCPHDYALTPGDLMKLSGDGDILVKNGLQLDDVICEGARRANPSLRIVDSSRGITDLIPEDEDDVSSGEHGEEKAADHDDHDHDHAHAEHDDHDHDHAHAEHDDHADHDDHDHDHGHAGHVHHHAGGNPHLFGSPFQAIGMVRNIAEQLSELDPANEAVYRSNAEAYCKELAGLCREFTEASRQWTKRCFAAQHDVFSYLIRDLALDHSVLVRASGEQAPSAAEVRHLVQVIRDRRIPVIFTEPQYPKALPEMIAREAGIQADVLDPVASGPADADPEYYVETMRKNLDTLNRYLK